MIARDRGWVDPQPLHTMFHHPSTPRASVAELIEHARRNVSDAEIARDADCLTWAASNDDDRRAMRRYVRLRRSARGYSPGDSRRNSHDAIPSEALAALATPVRPRHTLERACSVCRSLFIASRKDARYCSTRCRVRSHRVTDRGPVSTLPGLPDQDARNGSNHPQDSNDSEGSIRYSGTPVGASA